MKGVGRMKKEQRKASLMPNGVPKWIRCYDNGGESIDRYTVIFTRSHNFGLKNRTIGLAMNDAPYHPQGFGQHFDYDHPIDKPSYKHLGKKIKFQDLPEDCQKLVIKDYKYYWNL
jgi:hypothetical protein